MEKRDTRVQVVVLWNGKYILVKQTSKKENRFFWGLPGGGKMEGETEEEAAIREVEEETGLIVKLLPIKVEAQVFSKDSFYNRKVTFLAFPVDGKMQLGFDPEPKDDICYTLTDIKWHDLYRDDDIDDIVKSQVQHVREKLEAFPFIKRAAALIYKVENNKVYYLLVSENDTTDTFIIPQGHHEEGETLEETAAREAREESGVISEIERRVGFFLFENKEMYYFTEVYLCRFIGQGGAEEGKKIKWAAFEELKDIKMHDETKRFISEVNEEFEENFGRDGRVII